MRFVLVLLLLSSCGSAELFQTGWYEVELSYTIDEWQDSLAGTKKSIIWRVYKDDASDTYKLYAYPSDTMKVNGVREDNKIVFRKTVSSVVCNKKTDYTIELTPVQNEFVGYQEVLLGLCDGSVLKTKADVYGINMRYK